MPHVSQTIIRHEHRALSAMLRSMTLLLGQHRRNGTVPEFDALRAMLFYVDEFHEKLHHPKESRLLFPKLRGRSPETDAVLDRLDRDHARGEHSIRDLEHALLGFELMGESRREKFETSMKRYVGFCLEHMRVEESEVLPLADTALSDDDWAELDAAFLTNRDPFAGYEADAVYRPLFEKIIGALKSSSGVGSALEALAGAAPPRFTVP